MVALPCAPPGVLENNQFFLPMRPSRSVLDLEVKSVKKKFKDKSFASGVNREVVRSGCEMLGMELDAVIRETIAYAALQNQLDRRN